MFKLTEVYFCQRDEYKNLSVAPTEDSVIYLACFRDSLCCRW